MEGEERARGDALSGVVDRRRRLARAQVRLPPDVAMGDGVAVLRVDDVEVEAHRAVVGPLADVVVENLRDVAGNGAHQAFPQRGARPVDLARPPGLVLYTLGEIVRHRPGSVIAAELRVAHRDLALAPAPLSVLVVQEAKVHTDLGHLLVHVALVRVLEGAHADIPVGVESR